MVNNQTVNSETFLNLAKRGHNKIFHMASQYSIINEPLILKHGFVL